MTQSISSLVVLIKERVASCGTSGVDYLQVMEQFSVPPKAAFVIAQRFVEGDGFSFKVGEQPVQLSSLTFDQFTAELEQLRCHASPVEVDRACGVVDPGVILEEEGLLRNILEKVAASGPRGCLISEVARSDAGTQTHSSVDKLVGLGYLVKQSINPIAKGKQYRCDSKAVVLHNKVNAPYYDEEADGVKVIVSTSYLERIHSLIVDILDRRNVHSLPARDLARCLGMSRWDMQALRNATIVMDKKEGAKVKFFQKMCSFQLENGTLGTERLMWCAARSEDQVFLDAAAGTLSFVSPRNLPVHETIAAALNDGDRGRAGITAADIRAITGASYKRAAKVFTEFHKVLGYPLEKVQDGKQLRHKILPKQRPPQQAESAASETPPVEAAAAALPVPAPANLLSDQQLLNCEVIVEFLQQNNGIASVMDIVTEVRTQSRKRQQQLLLTHPGGIVLPPSSNAMDRRTIDRTLHLLEHTMGRVTTRVLEAALPVVGNSSAPDATSAVVLLRETGQSDEDMIATYVARQLAAESETKAALESGEGSAKKPGPTSAKKRKRRVQDSSSSEEDEEVDHSPVAAVEDNTLKSAAGGKRAAKVRIDDDSGESDVSPEKGPTAKAAASAAAVETTDGDARLRRTLRNRALKQKKRNDDPALFDWRGSMGDALPELPPAQVAGELVAAMCLHAHLLRALPVPAEGVHGEEPPQLATTALAAAMDSLPFEFFYATSASLRDAFSAFHDQSPDSVSALQTEVNEALLERASLHQAASAGSETLAALLAGCREDLERETAALMSLLAAMGVVRIGDGDARAALATLLKSTVTNSSEESQVRVQQVAARFDDSAGVLRAARPDRADVLTTLRAFAELHLLLTFADPQHTSPVARFLGGQAVALEVVPLGAWQQLRSDLDVYHHWRTVVLPSLPVDWRALTIDSSMSSLGVHLLRYWECERGGDLPENVPPSSMFRRVIFTALLKMDQWGSPLVRQAWETLETFSWKALLLPLNTPDVAAESGDNAGYPDSSAFSLDMPRRTNAKRKPKRTLDVPAKAATMATPTPRKRRSKAPVKDDGDWSGPGEDGDQQDLNESWDGDQGGSSGVRQTWSAQDPQLQEELLGLQAAGSSAEWTAAQVALVLEVVLINFFVRAKKEDALPGMLRTGSAQSSDAVGTGSDAFCSVGLPSSFLDVRWDETDFALVAESLIGAAIASSHIPDQKVARNRIMQCIKYRPALRSVVAWILCNKGSRVSPTFARLISQLGGPKKEEEGEQTKPHAVFALLAQSYGDGGEQLPARKAELEALRRFPFSLVTQVTRELFVLGFLRQVIHCGSAKCKEAKSACKHTKRAFELTELYEDAQSDIAGALFFKKWLECCALEPQESPAGADGMERISWGALLATAQKEWDTPSVRVLCLSHALSLSADAVTAALDVQVLDGECALAERAQPLSDSVTLMDPDVCDEHSGFCEKSLNAVSAHMAAAAGPTVSARPERERVAGVGSGPRESGVAVPWEVWEDVDGERRCHRNHALLRLLSAKVLAVLAEKPGSSAAAIHTAVLVLSAAQVEELLRALLQEGQVVKRVPTVQTRRRGLFAAASGSERQHSAEPAYFVNNSL